MVDNFIVPVAGGEVPRQHHIGTTGTECDDVIEGRKGDDKLYGLAGDDVLDGGKGFDKMYGGEGNDVYYVDKTCRTSR